MNLAFIDWSRQERDTRQESRTASEQLDHDMDRDRSIEELVDSVLEENQSGSSSSGGGGASLDLGIFSIGGGGALPVARLPDAVTCRPPPSRIFPTVSPSEALPCDHSGQR